MTETIAFRHATAEDALCLSVLATQVFFDTYATNGINRDLAKEVRSVYSPEVLTARLIDPTVEITVAEIDNHLVAFLDVSFKSTCPAPAVGGLEVFRLYVQAPFQRRGFGRALMLEAEAIAARQGVAALWLTAWSGNTRALSFYRSLGFQDVGATQYVIEGQAYENRVLAKQLAHAA